MQTNLIPAEADRVPDGAVLGLLPDRDSQRPWSVDEVMREMRAPIATADNFAAAGLIHRCGDFVWPTRAALRAEEIAM